MATRGAHFVARAFVAVALLACSSARAQDQSAPESGAAVVPAAPEQQPLGVPTHREATRAARSSETAAAPSTAPNSWMGGTALSLGGVLVLIGAAFWVLRAAAARSPSLRLALGSPGRAPSGVLEVLGRYPIARGASILLLKIDRRILVLGQSPAGRLGGASMSTLCEITDPEEVASILVKTRDADGDSIAERFRSLLNRYDDGHAAAEAPEASARRTVVGRSGDRAELWDAARDDIPVVDLTRRAAPAERPAGLRALRERLASSGDPDNRRVRSAEKWP